MSFPRYPKYKNSCVAWLGKVPEHWDVSRLSLVSDILAGHSFDASLFGFDGIPVIRMSDFGEGLVQVEDAKRVDAANVPEKSLALSGDVLLGLSGSISNFAVVREQDLPIAINQRVAVVRIHESHRGSVKWFLQSKEFINQLTAELPETTIQNISMGQLRRCKLPLPPRDEQTLLAEFLDRETAKIDELVVEQRRLIELLKEKRQAVISHAVTKGLNPQAPMKPSGIEWLGQIPKTWNVQRLKRLVCRSRRITYGIVQPGESDPLGRFMIRGKDYSCGWCQPDEIFRVSSEIEIPYTRSRVRVNDLVMTIVGAGVGNVALIPDWLDGSNITQTTARIAVDPAKLEPAFVCYALQGVIGQRNLERNVYGSAQPRLNIEHVDSYLMTVPPIEEQRQIVEVVNLELDQFKELVAEAQRGIDLLQERRLALISAAVTGKIDVRGLVVTEAA